MKWGGCVDGEGRAAEGRRLGGIFCLGGSGCVVQGRCGWCVVLERMTAGGYCRIRKSALVSWVITLRLAGGYGY